MTYGKLFIVGMPIGNWSDLSIRSVNYLKNAENIVIERADGFEELCKEIGIKKEYKKIISISYDSDGSKSGEQQELNNMYQIIDILKSGENVYMVSDEGMPGVADPGSILVKECIGYGIEISSTPGPSVVMAAAGVTGITNGFTFESFLPFEQGERIEFLKNRKFHHYPMIILLRNAMGISEFNPEIPAFLNNAIAIFGKYRNAALCYNLTMSNEFVKFGTLAEIQEYFLSTEKNLKDQICIVVDGVPGTMGKIYKDVR